MRPVFGIGLLLICMTLILDYSSSVIIRDNKLIHSEFCRKYENTNERGSFRHTLSAIQDLSFGEQLCTLIGTDLHGDDVNCQPNMFIVMSVASSVPQEDSFHTYGQLCRCKNRMGTQLADFCIKRLKGERINVIYILQPRVQQIDFEINPDTVLYVDAMYLFPSMTKTQKF